MNTTEKQTSLEFTEQMKGHVTYGVDNPAQGAIASDKIPLKVKLTIHVSDIDTFIEHRDHLASITGHVYLGDPGDGVELKTGRFNLFVDTERDTKRMYYLIHFLNAENSEQTLYGYKLIHNDEKFDIWSDTTTLYSYIFKGHLDDIPEDDVLDSALASGIINIYMRDFLKQLTTFRVGAQSPLERLQGLKKFGMFFFGSLWEIYADRFSIMGDK